MNRCCYLLSQASMGRGSKALSWLGHLENLAWARIQCAPAKWGLRWSLPPLVVSFNPVISEIGWGMEGKYFFSPKQVIWEGRLCLTQWQSWQNCRWRENEFWLCIQLWKMGELCSCPCSCYCLHQLTAARQSMASVAGGTRKDVGLRCFTGEPSVFGTVSGQLQGRTTCCGVIPSGHWLAVLAVRRPRELSLHVSC